jgi:hypothetical protein
MNILVAHNFYKLPGGEDQCVAAEIAMLRAHGHRVTQYCLSNDATDGMGRLELAGRTIWSRPSKRCTTFGFSASTPSCSAMAGLARIASVRRSPGAALRTTATATAAPPAPLSRR